VEPFTEVTGLSRSATGFELTVRGRDGAARPLPARHVALATGYFDQPNRLGVPGEDLPHVSHYYDEAHPHYGRDVVIVGAGSSAADAALDLHRAGARVTLVHRGEGFRHSLKYWIRPNLENRVAEGSITAHFGTFVREIAADAVRAEKDGRPLRIPADRVFLLTGYHAAGALLRQVGARVDPTTLAAELDASFQTTVPGLYCIGSAGFGRRTSDVFIENGLVHARRAIDAIAARVGQPSDA
jgi:thioredoxin reductase (NADPH)